VRRDAIILQQNQPNVTYLAPYGWFVDKENHQFVFFYAIVHPTGAAIPDKNP
jgi:hypothetical protein